MDDLNQNGMRGNVELYINGELVGAVHDVKFGRAPEAAELDANSDAGDCCGDCDCRDNAGADTPTASLTGSDDDGNTQAYPSANDSPLSPIHEINAMMASESAAFVARLAPFLINPDLTAAIGEVLEHRERLAEHARIGVTYAGTLMDSLGRVSRAFLELGAEFDTVSDELADVTGELDAMVAANTRLLDELDRVHAELRDARTDGGIGLTGEKLQPTFDLDSDDLPIGIYSASEQPKWVADSLPPASPQSAGNIGCQSSPIGDSFKIRNTGPEAIIIRMQDGRLVIDADSLEVEASHVEAELYGLAAIERAQA